MLPKSAESWEQRYASGNFSGYGSRGHLAEYKAEYINRQLGYLKITSATELGCGDGYQLKLLRCPTYVGLDVSATIVERCNKLFAKDTSKSFVKYVPGDTDVAPYRSELALSLDVIYHVAEDWAYEQYLLDLFSMASKFVIIYGIDNDGDKRRIDWKSRKFSKWIEHNKPGWELIAMEKQPYPNDSDADFYMWRLK